ncbi:MAG: hypothetical protein E6J45_10615 [Chloroflexi bacterium]|nr:MAG: hypothetical protein E6J45_10615 [Chloroflexota bacterium]
MPEPDPEATAHLAGCASCRRWRNRARDLRQLALAAVPAAPDPEPRWRRSLVARLPLPGGARTRLIRLGLIFAAAAEAVLTLPLQSPQLPDATHDWGASGVAFSFAFVLVAIRPERAPGAAPVAGAAGLLLVGIELLELSLGRGALLDLSGHLLVLGGSVLVWLLGRRPHPLGSNALPA